MDKRRGSGITTRIPCSSKPSRLIGYSSSRKSLPTTAFAALTVRSVHLVPSIYHSFAFSRVMSRRMTVLCALLARNLPENKEREERIRKSPCWLANKLQTNEPRGLVLSLELTAQSPRSLCRHRCARTHRSVQKKEARFREAWIENRQFKKDARLVEAATENDKTRSRRFLPSSVDPIHSGNHQDQGRLHKQSLICRFLLLDKKWFGHESSLVTVPEASRTSSTRKLKSMSCLTCARHISPASILTT